MTAKLRFALVGAGVIGTHHGLVISQLADRIELAAVVDIEAEKAERLAAKRGGRPFTSLTDALAADGAVVPAGKGDGEVDRTIRALRHDGFDGFFSLEPHLAAGTAVGGFSGPDLFRTAWQAFTDLLSAEGIEYR